MATVDRIWNDHQVQMSLLLRTSYLTVGNAAVSADLLGFDELAQALDKKRVLTTQDRTQLLLSGIVNTMKTKPTEADRLEDFDTFLKILSREGVLDSLRQDLRSLQKERGVEKALSNQLSNMSRLFQGSLTTIAMYAHQEGLVADNVLHSVTDADADHEEYFIGRILVSIRTYIGNDLEQLQKFINKVLKPMGGFLDKLVKSMEDEIQKQQSSVITSKQSISDLPTKGMQEPHRRKVETASKQPLSETPIQDQRNYAVATGKKESESVPQKVKVTTKFQKRFIIFLFISILFIFSIYVYNKY